MLRTHRKFGNLNRDCCYDNTYQSFKTPRDAVHSCPHALSLPASPGTLPQSWVPAHFPGPRWPDHAYLLEKCHPNGREKGKPPSERTSVLAHALAYKVRRRDPRVRGGVSAGSLPWESSWNPRPARDARCACAHLPPGSVWIRRDPAEPQVRPACQGPASGRPVAESEPRLGH